MEITDIRVFLEYWENIRQRTVRVAQVIPRERIEWTHQPGKFTFGDILRHLAGIERYMYAENAQCKPSRYPGHGREIAEGYDAVFEYLERLHRESTEIFARLTQEDLQKRCTLPSGTTIPVWKWLRAMVEHEVHHRGQIYLSLGILGVKTPPLYGLTSEEVRERSVP